MKKRILLSLMTLLLVGQYSPVSAWPSFANPFKDITPRKVLYVSGALLFAGSISYCLYTSFLKSRWDNLYKKYQQKQAQKYQQKQAQKYQQKQAQTLAEKAVKDIGNLFDQLSDLNTPIDIEVRDHNLHFRIYNKYDPQKIINVEENLKNINYTHENSQRRKRINELIKEELIEDCIEKVNTLGINLRYFSRFPNIIDTERILLYKPGKLNCPPKCQTCSELKLGKVFQFRHIKNKEAFRKKLLEKWQSFKELEKKAIEIEKIVIKNKILNATSLLSAIQNTKQIITYIKRYLGNFYGFLGNIE